MAKKRVRIFAFIAALLFFVTSFGLSFLVLWQMHVDSQQNKANSSQASSPHPAATPNQNKLAGTKLDNFTPTAHIATLQTIDKTVGTGQTIKSTDTVTVNYTGAVAATGTIFQSSFDSGQPVSFPLNQVITGWTNGIPGMKAGGTRRLLIPAAQAYGANPPPSSGIPPNADLVFDVWLIKIGK